MQPQLKSKKTPWHLIVVFLILSIALFTSGFFYYTHEKQRIKQSLQDELTAIADLKVKQITDWRHERLGDAIQISNNHLLINEIQEWLRNPSLDYRREVFEWLQSTQEFYGYQNILLIDPKGNVRLSVPDEKNLLGPDSKRLFSEAMKSGKVIFSDLYRSKVSNAIRLGIFVPLIPHDKNRIPVGLILLRIDPYQFLYPLIQSWPTPSKSGETMLVRREGNEVVFLNELRHKKITALSFKVPITKKHLPSVMAAEGYRGIFDNVNYRGIPVLAVTRSIPETSWNLVAQVDAEEVYAPVQEQFWVIALITTLLIIASGIGLGFIWKHQRADLYRRQYEMEHQHSALLERFEYLTSHANDIILLADDSYRIVEANERAVQSYGYERDELLTLAIGNLRTLETRKLLNGQMEEVKTRNGFVYEAEHQQKDGTVFPVEISSRVIDIKGKKFYQYIIRDITERKMAEEELRRINRALKTISECNQALVRISEEQTLLNEICKIIVTIGGQRLAWVGYAEHDEKKTVRPVSFAGYDEGFCERLHVTWADTEFGKGPSGTAIRTRKPAVFNNTSTDPALVPWRKEMLKRSYKSVIGLPLIINSDSIGALIICAGEPDAFHGDEVRLFTELANDLAFGISALRIREEHLRTEEEIKQLNEELVSIYDNAPLIMLLVDENWKIRKTNAFTAQFVGTMADNMVNRRCGEALRCVHALDSPEGCGFGPSCKECALRLTILNTIETGRSHNEEEVSMFFSDGENERKAIFLLSTKKLHIREQPLALVSIQDISGRKQAEQQMLSLQAQLQQSQKMEAIGHLAGGIAHDFNNLLTVISIQTQLALRGLREGDPLKEKLTDIEQAADRAANLTRQLLAFSRRQILDIKVLNLNTIVRNLEKMLHRIIGEDLELTSILADDLGMVKVDPGQMEQVIVNLVVNSRDAMPQGGKLTIETTNVELDEGYAHTHMGVMPGLYIELSVSDTGIGMSKEVKEQIFDPFFTTKEKGKGTGLGLSTVYGIVKQTGGDIYVYSEVDKGTTFKIYFPRVFEPGEELAKKEAGKEALRGEETILVLEDDAVVRKLSAAILKNQGYTVLEAEAGGEALLVCEQYKKPIHLILTDVVMPKMSGAEFIEQLKQVRKDFKVLYMTGYADNAITHHGLLGKGINLIQKPFSIENLARKVREVLDKN